MTSSAFPFSGRRLVPNSSSMHPVDHSSVRVDGIERSSLFAQAQLSRKLIGHPQPYALTFARRPIFLYSLPFPDLIFQQPSALLYPPPLPSHPGNPK